MPPDGEGGRREVTAFFFVSIDRRPLLIANQLWEPKVASRRVWNSEISIPSL